MRSVFFPDKKKILLRGFIAMTALLSSEGFAGPLSLKASCLVQAMQLDRATLMSVQVYYRNSMQNDDKMFSRFKECLNSKRTEITSIYANVAVEKMTLEEMNVAINFYESSAGKKYSFRDLAPLEKALGLVSDMQSDLSVEENEILQNFTKTMAGKKLVVDKIIHPESLQRAIIKGANEIAQACLQEAKGY